MRPAGKRCLALFLTALIVFALLLSVCSVVIEATHECTGGDCGVCRILGMIAHVIRSLALTAFVLSILLTDSIRRYFCCFTARIRRSMTPVTEKVRLLN